MQKTFLRCGRWLLVGTLFFAIGGHWALLQTVAWASMVVDYSRQVPVIQAVEKTFDGQHPCSLCKDIQQSRQSEQKHEALLLLKKIELFDQPAVAFVYPVTDFLTLAVADRFPEVRRQAPPVPPPRSAAV